MHVHKFEFNSIDLHGAVTDHRHACCRLCSTSLGNMTGQELVFCICCNKHLPRKREREHHRRAHNLLTTPTPRKRPRLAFKAACTPRDDPKLAETQPTPSSERLEHHNGCATNSGLVLDVFSVDLEVLEPLNSTVTSESDHLEDPPSGEEHDTDQILAACMSRRWHRGINHSLPQLDEDRNASEHDSDAGSDGEDLGEGSDVPLEDEVIGDESDAINWDLLDQQCGTTLRDELREDFEAWYAKIGA